MCHDHAVSFVLMSETLCETVSVEAIIVLLSERLTVLLTGAFEHRFYYHQPALFYNRPHRDAS